MIFYLTALFAGLLVVSNILAVKVFTVLGFDLPAAVIVYMATFLNTDVIGEVYGKKMASRAIRAGFVAQIFVLFFIYIAIEVPAAPFFEMQTEYEMILGGSFQVIIASLVSYLVSQNLDVFIFHKLKERHGRRHLWLRNNFSAVITQFVDTSIFIVIAFIGTVPANVLISMIFMQYIAKIIIVILDTPIVYLLVGVARKQLDKERALLLSVTQQLN